MCCKNASRYALFPLLMRESYPEDLAIAFLYLSDDEIKLCVSLSELPRVQAGH